MLRQQTIALVGCYCLGSTAAFSFLSAPMLTGGSGRSSVASAGAGRSCSSNSIFDASASPSCESRGGRRGEALMYSAFAKKGGKKGKKGKGGAGRGGGGKGKSTPKPKPSATVDTSRKDFIYQMNGLTKTYGGPKDGGKGAVLENINLSFYPGAKIGVLGNNGSGKSTLMKIMAGLDEEFNGESRMSDWAQVGYLSQEPSLDDGESVGENIQASVKKTRDLLDAYADVSAAMTEEGADFEKLTEKMDTLQNEIEATNGWELDRMLDRAMDALRCPPVDAKVANLSGGERRRVALCKLLLRKPDLLLLDEPTNHLDAESVAWLEDFLKSFKGTVVAITHDRYFLDNVAGWILELDNRKGYPFEGNYSGWLQKKAERMKAEERTNSKRARNLAQELEWVNSDPKARQAKSKARMSAYDELLAEAEEADKRVTLDNIYIPPGPALGKTVVKAEGVAKYFGDRMLYDGVNFDIPRGAVVGVIGPNGVGKSTLLKMIEGTLEPDQGTMSVGSTVETLFVDQNREGLDDPSLTVYDAVAEGMEELNLGSRTINTKQYLSWFNFRGGDHQKLVSMLSGGERNRLNLARTLKKPGNLLMLDEPTNDLDVDTLRALEEAISEFVGSAIIVSHDRYFLDRVATHILAFEDSGEVTFYQGNFGEYEADLHRRIGITEPKRPTFRPIPSVQ